MGCAVRVGPTSTRLKASRKRSWETPAAFEATTASAMDSRRGESHVATRSRSRLTLAMLSCSPMFMRWNRAVMNSTARSKVGTSMAARRAAAASRPSGPAVQLAARSRASVNAAGATRSAATSSRTRSRARAMNYVSAPEAGLVRGVLSRVNVRKWAGASRAAGVKPGLGFRCAVAPKNPSCNATQGLFLGQFSHGAGVSQLRFRPDEYPTTAGLRTLRPSS